MSFVTRLSQVVPAFTRVQNKGRYLTTALRVCDVHLQPDNSCSLTNDAVTSTRTALKSASPPVLGNAFLEDVTSEYGMDLVKSSLELTHSKTIHPSRVIVNFVEKGDYDAAEVARKEFEKLDLSIQPHPAYLRMALHAIEITDQRTRHQAFSAWIALTPLYEHREVMTDIADHLLRRPFDLSLLEEFCLSCVRNGIIGELVQSRLLHHVFRYGHPKASISLLGKLEGKAQSVSKSEAKIMTFRNLAIKMLSIAGYQDVAEQLMKRFAFYYRTEQVTSREDSSRVRNVALPRTTRSRETRGRKTLPDVTEMASKLRRLREAIKAKAPRRFESYVSDFIFEYCVLLQRTRAVYALRRRVFQSASLTVRTKWVAAEQLYYSSQNHPLAILRSHLHFFVAEQQLHSEAQRILYNWENGRLTHRKKQVDSALAHDLPPISMYEKLWPSNISLALAWKAVIQLSSVEDLERLYMVLVNHTKSFNTHDNSEIETQDPEASETSLFVTPPANFPSPMFFHHFIVAMATRISPLRGSKVIADMEHLGLKPTIDDWGTIAGAYARSGDIRRLQSIMTHVDKLEAAATAPESTQTLPEKKSLRERVIVMHGSVIRGLTECGMYPEAREVQQRMQNRGYFDNGIGIRMRAILHRLSRYEKGLFDDQLEKRNVVRLMGREIRADRRRIQWKRELDRDGKPTWVFGFDEEFFRVADDTE